MTVPRPVICQAGGSPAGRDFAARHADTIIALVRDVASARAYRADITARMQAHGRDPGSCKVLFCTSVIIGETVEEAKEERRRRIAALESELEPRLAALSFYAATDLSKFDLDEPLPAIATNASRTMVDVYTAGAGQRTLREMVLDLNNAGIPFVGCPDSIAAEMTEAMAEIGGDGYLMTEPLSRRAIDEIAEGLTPALQRRGATRTTYTHKTLRDNLLAF